MDPKNVTRYIRPQDVPSLDPTILDPILSSAAQEMSVAYPERTEDEWRTILMQSLIDGEVLIVIDDRQKRVGLVRSDRPPFLGLVQQPPGHSTINPADPLDLMRWEKDS